MTVATLKDVLNRFSYITTSSQLSDTDELVIFYNEHLDAICAGWTLKENINKRKPVRLVIPKDEWQNLTEETYNYYVNKLKEKIKITNLQEDF